MRGARGRLVILLAASHRLWLAGLAAAVGAGAVETFSATIAATGTAMSSTVGKEASAAASARFAEEETHGRSSLLRRAEKSEDDAPSIRNKFDSAREAAVSARRHSQAPSTSSAVLDAPVSPPSHGEQPFAFSQLLQGAVQASRPSISSWHIANKSSAGPSVLMQARATSFSVPESLLPAADREEATELHAAGKTDQNEIWETRATGQTSGTDDVEGGEENSFGMRQKGISLRKIVKGLILMGIVGCCCLCASEAFAQRRASTSAPRVSAYSNNNAASNAPASSPAASPYTATSSVTDDAQQAARGGAVRSGYAARRGKAATSPGPPISDNTNAPADAPGPPPSTTVAAPALGPTGTHRQAAPGSYRQAPPSDVVDTPQAAPVTEPATPLPSASTREPYSSRRARGQQNTTQAPTEGTEAPQAAPVVEPAAATPITAPKREPYSSRRLRNQNNSDQAEPP
eukprot:TRINITY_DN7933_c0_g1_i1.p1 TRINITY_DN7933_c0_g1~~TRINITY_DN7933_c0_g1_i1.p1  ORF type:complete len:460 (-),score=56.44 TRINITY_DN7933_c0_g1_i1:94-1473(-)